jgi:hypothetical protein
MALQMEQVRCINAGFLLKRGSPLKHPQQTLSAHDSLLYKALHILWTSSRPCPQIGGLLV